MVSWQLIRLALNGRAEDRRTHAARDAAWLPQVSMGLGMVECCAWAL